MKAKDNYKKRHIIYLDQFGTSGIFESSEEEWISIRNLIKEGVEKGYLICPMSAEHFLESSQKEPNKAIHLDDLFYTISGGYAFKSELYITSQLISSLLRGNNITVKTYLHDEIKENVLTNNATFFNEKKQELNSKIEEGVKGVNEVRKHTGVLRVDKKKKKLLMDASKALEVNNFLQRLKEFDANGYIPTKMVKFSSGDVPYWGDQVIHRLIKKHKLTRKEIKRLIAHIEVKGFDYIPTLDIRTSLTAIIGLYGKKEIVNDHIDIMRISTGLPLSCVLLTDKKRKAELLELGLDQKYNTLVFSGVKEDLKSLIKKLEEIKTSDIDQ